MTLQVALFGSPRLTDKRGRILEPTGVTSELLGLLIVHPGERASRDHLADCLWPDGDPDRNRKNLNTTLWRLRGMMEPDARGTYLHSHPGGYIGFNREADYSCDVEELEQALSTVQTSNGQDLSDSQLDHLRRVVKLYRGDLLEGVMSEWVLPHRDRLARAYQECLLKLMKATSLRGLSEESVYWAERILEQDPVREDVHRALMETYQHTGRRTLALRQYDRMKKILEVELHTRPSRETEALYCKVIEQGTSHGEEAEQSSDLHDVLELLSAIQRQLAEGMHLLASHLTSRS